MELVSIFHILLLASAASLSISLIFYLNRVTKSVKEIENNIKDIAIQLKPLIASTTNLTEKLNYISEQAKAPVTAARDMVDEVKDRVDDILLFEEKIRNGLEGPVLGFVQNVSGVLNGVNAFWNTYKNKSNNL